MPRSAAQHEFARAVSNPYGDVDLTRLALLIARCEFETLDIAAIEDRLATLAARALAAAPVSVSAHERLRRLTRFFTAEGFTGDRRDYYNPANSYLNTVLERRRGLPITLSILLIDLAGRLGLTLRGVALPAHFMTRWHDNDSEVFIDVFNGCEWLSRPACRARVAALLDKAIPLSAADFAPATNRAIVYRMLANLRGVYLATRDVPRAIRTLELMLIMQPDGPRELRDLGQLYALAERPREAVVCLERSLELDPDSPDARRAQYLLDAVTIQVTTKRP